jgi:hypothetical protein
MVGSAGEAPRWAHEISGDATPGILRRAAPGQHQAVGLRGVPPRQALRQALAQNVRHRRGRRMPNDAAMLALGGDSA